LGGYCHATVVIGGEEIGTTPLAGQCGLLVKGIGSYRDAQGLPRQNARRSRPDAPPLDIVF